MRKELQFKSPFISILRIIRKIDSLIFFCMKYIAFRCIFKGRAASKLEQEEQNYNVRHFIRDLNKRYAKCLEQRKRLRDGVTLKQSFETKGDWKTLWGYFGRFALLYWRDSFAWTGWRLRAVDFWSDFHAKSGVKLERIFSQNVANSFTKKNL